jgi:Tfp pilus assembly protein PilF
LGAVLQRRGQVAEAFAAFEATTRLDPESAAAWGAMGLTAAQLHRPAEAARYWARAALDPAYFTSRPDEGTLYHQSIAVSKGKP